MTAGREICANGSVGRSDVGSQGNLRFPSQSSLSRRHDGQIMFTPSEECPRAMASGGWGGNEVWGREGRDALGIRLPCQAATYAGHGPSRWGMISRGIRVGSVQRAERWRAGRQLALSRQDCRPRLQLSIPDARPGIVDASIARLVCRRKNGPCSLVIGSERVLIGSKCLGCLRELQGCAWWRTPL